MAEVPNFKQYVRRALGSNPGEDGVEGGFVAPVDLMNIGRVQNLKFHKNGISFEEANARHGEAFAARASELVADLPLEEQQNEVSVGAVYNQVINEVFGPVVFGLEVLIKKQSDALDSLKQQLQELADYVTSVKSPPLSDN